MIVTIEIPAADEARITEAFGSILNLGQPATAPDIEQAMIVQINNQTHDYERRKNMQEFAPPPLEILPPEPPPEGGGFMRSAATSAVPSQSKKAKSKRFW